MFGLRRLYRSRRARGIAGLCCIVLTLISANVIAGRYLTAQLDLTAERLYTLSPGTLLTLRHIDEPINLSLYYSQRLGEAIPAYEAYAQRVEGLLAQYVAAANGKLQLEIHHPQPYSEDEDRAVAVGLQGVPLNRDGEQVYFGLAGTNSTDDQQVIRFFTPEREPFLEYDLTRLVHVLAYPKRTLVGLISRLPLSASHGQPPGPNALLRQLQQYDDVETLPPAIDAIPAGTDVLMLVHPHDLPPKTLFAIDQFVLRGGKAIVFVDPYCEAAMRGGIPGASPASDLSPLLKAWGLQLVPGTVAGDRHNARRVGVPNGSGGEQVMDYVAWLYLRGPELNRDDPITANVQSVALASAGILEPLPKATTHFEPLITTSLDAMKLPAAAVAGLPDVAGLLSRFKSDSTRYTLAARITGAAETAFPDGSPADAAAGDVLRKSVRPIDVVVIADADLLDDRLWARSEDFFGQPTVVPVAGNAALVANAVDVLAGGEDLVHLRSRGTSVRPFEVVDRIQREADAQYAAEQRALEQKLHATQAKLRSLMQTEPADATSALTPEQARAVAQFRADMLITRRQLREVQAALRKNIERLKTLLEFADIALAPLLVAAVALVFGALRARRRRSSRSAAAAGLL